MERVTISNSKARLLWDRVRGDQGLANKHWYQVKPTNSMGQAEIYLYDEIGLWGVTAANFVNELRSVEALYIDLHVNSPGGDVFDGVAIYNALCNHPASITTYIDGVAASAASFIAQAGGRVLMARNASMMIHDAEGICIGNAADMAEMAELLERTSNNIADIYAQRCSTVNVWRKAMKATTWYVGKEAVDAGLADGVYEPDQGTSDEPAERRRRATASVTSAASTHNERKPKPITLDVVEQTPITSDPVVAPEPLENDDIESWWNPDVFRTALATAAQQHNLYSFDADMFREVMRTAATEDFPSPPAQKLSPTEQLPPIRVASSKEFVDAIRKGLL